MEKIKLRNPYPVDMCLISNDKELAILLPDTTMRSTVAWYLMGKGYDVAKQDLEDALSELSERSAGDNNR